MYAGGGPISGDAIITGTVAIPYGKKKGTFKDMAPKKKGAKAKGFGKKKG